MFLNNVAGNVVAARLDPHLKDVTLWVVWAVFGVAMVVAVRQALDFTSTTRAIGVCVLGWTLAIGIAVTLGLLFGPTLS